MGSVPQTIRITDLAVFCNNSSCFVFLSPIFIKKIKRLTVKYLLEL